MLAFVNKHRPHLVQALTLVAAVCMVLSAYYFRPQPDSLVRYRPTPGPKDYYDPRALLFFVIGALALLGSLALARRAVPSRPLAGGKLDALRPSWAWVLVVPGMVLLLAVAEINGQMVAALNWMWHASPHVQFALLVAGIVLLVGGLGGLPKTSPPGPLSTRGEEEVPSRVRVRWLRRGDPWVARFGQGLPCPYGDSASRERDPGGEGRTPRLLHHCGSAWRSSWSCC